MDRSLVRVLSVFVATLMCVHAAKAQDAANPDEVKVNWAKVMRVSKSTPTLQVVPNPQLLRGAKLHDSSFAALHMLGADYVRYAPWNPYPHLAVAELSAPANGKTSWDFSHIDPMFDDFMKATEGHSIVLNFSPIPTWMFKNEKPVIVPSDPNQVFWDHTPEQLRDLSMTDLSEYYARLLSWYTKGGFTDEYGKRWESGHHYKIAYWEVLNEIEFTPHWTPEVYTKFYDLVTTALRKVDPQIKFSALALAYPGEHPEMFEYFLNPANHKSCAPLDFISYHFYAVPTPGQTIKDWQYTFFDQADGLFNTVRYVEEIRKRYSPSTKTDMDELGTIIAPEDEKEISHPGYIAKPEPEGYWNLSGAVYAYIYLEAAKLGIDVIGESQLVGYHSQYPSVSMMNYDTAKPNARFWVLKLLKDNFGPGDKLIETTNPNKDLSVQAFEAKGGKTLLVINKRNHAEQLTLPADAEGAMLSLVAPSTGDHEAAQEKLQGRVLSLQPFEVTVVQYK